MKTVQVAIQDPEYADSVRNLLIQDGGHLVHLVPKPDVTLDGVIVVDAADLDGLPLSNEKERLVVMVRKEQEDLSKIWEAGVRHVVFEGDPPQTARVIVLGVELSLVSRVTAGPESFHPGESNPSPGQEAAGTQKSNRRPPKSSLGSTTPGQCRARTEQPKH